MDPAALYFAQRALVVVEGQLLSLRREYGAGDAWDLPGGRLGAREGLDVSLERETLEEAGVRVLAGRVLDIERWDLVIEGAPRIVVVAYRHAAILSAPSKIGVQNQDRGEGLIEAAWLGAARVRSVPWLPSMRSTVCRLAEEIL